jgi:hypothetical protein
MHLIIKSSVNRYHKNLLTSNKVTTLILDKYIDMSRYDLILIICEVSYECL